LINLHVLHGGRDRLLCAWIDTGFNGSLLWESATASLLDFPGEISSLYQSVEVAGGTIMASLGDLSVKWFAESGVYSRVETLVARTDRDRPRQEPQVLIGTALLSGKILTVDFLDGLVAVQSSG
jgi:hypothetical protein